jgi:hypothetical protein
VEERPFEGRVSSPENQWASAPVVRSRFVSLCGLRESRRWPIQAVFWLEWGSSIAGSWRIGKGTSSTRAAGQPKRMRLSAAEARRFCTEVPTAVQNRGQTEHSHFFRAKR